jgi:purine nucleosidase
LGVTAVAGNVPLAQTSDNARRILELAGHGEVKVFAGAERPILRPARPVPEIHGDTGIDGWDWAPAKQGPETAHAVDWMVETLLREPSGSVSLVALAPQTNIALALRRAPAIAGRIARLAFKLMRFSSARSWDSSPQGAQQHSALCRLGRRQWRNTLHLFALRATVTSFLDQ